DQHCAARTFMQGIDALNGLAIQRWNLLPIELAPHKRKAGGSACNEPVTKGRKSLNGCAQLSDYALGATRVYLDNVMATCHDQLFIAIDRHVFQALALKKDVCVFKEIIGLQRAIKHGDRSIGLADAKKTIMYLFEFFKHAFK